MASNKDADDLEEDEHGYVNTRKPEISRDLLRQLPSRQFDAPDDLNPAVRRRSTVKRVAQYRTLQLKNATLNSHELKVDAQKIYEILSTDPKSNEEEKVKTLRAMPQSLSIKRQVKQKLDSDRRKKIALSRISLRTRFKLWLFMAWKKFTHKINSIISVLAPWQSSIKTIRGKYGSNVVSYFIFLRWLLYINICNFVIIFCFIVTPQLVHQSTQSADNRTSFHFSDFLTGSGWLTNSLFYFGRYTNKVIGLGSETPYNMGLAYIMTMIVIFVINLIAVSFSITQSYQLNYVDTAGEMKNVFCNKVFSAWDYAVETEEGAQLLKKAFFNDMEELLYRKRESRERTTKERIVQKISFSLFSLITLAAISGIGYLVYYLQKNKVLKVDVPVLQDLVLALTVAFISNASYFLLKNASILELYWSRRVKAYLTMIRISTLRMVMLGIIVYFWMIHYDPPSELFVCFETELGKEIYRIILINFLVVVLLFTFTMELLRKGLSKWIPAIQRSTFDVGYNTLDLLFYQILAWIGIFCVPLSSLMIIFILVILFYVKKLSLEVTCKPPKRSWSANEAQTFYLLLTFFIFFFAAITVGYSVFGVSVTRNCGPFRGYNKTGDILHDVFVQKSSGGPLSDIIAVMSSHGVLIAIFCALCLVVYYMRAQAKAHISVIEKHREHLVLTRKDKVYLLRLFEEATNAQQPSSNKQNNLKAKDHQPHLADCHHEFVYSDNYTNDMGAS